MLREAVYAIAGNPISAHPSKQLTGSVTDSRAAGRPIGQRRGQLGDPAARAEQNVRNGPREAFVSHELLTLATPALATAIAEDAHEGLG